MTTNRARRPAALARVALAAGGTLLLAAETPPAVLAAAGGLALLALSGLLVGWGGPRMRALDGWLAVPIAVLLVGLQGGAESPLVAFWVASVGCGVLARDAPPGLGQVAAVAAALTGFAAADGRLATDLAALGVSTILLVAVCGRVGAAARDEARRATYAAAHDHLTGVATHSAFRRRFEQALARGETVGMLLVDLDDFGGVNRRAGHLEGDRVLALAARTLRRAAGPAAFVGRLGGDEFGVLLAAEDAEAAARRIVGDLALGPLAGHALGASIGLALLPEDGTDWETVVARADLALREVKGRGKAAVGRSRPHDLLSHGALSGEVRALWERDRIAIWVQPIVDAAAGAVHGYEALARFEGGDGPATWFARADSVGLRVELEVACLERALVLFAQRPAGTTLSVNLSAPALSSPRVRALLLGAGDLHGLVVEVTEEALLRGADTLERSLAPLLAAGAQLALDDMGTGEASLRHLAELRPSLIKLDRSVVSGLHADPARAALVDAFVGYAERTGALVVAEGVEEHAELECLVALNTPLVQGYLTGRPAPPWPRVPARATAPRALDRAVVDVAQETTAEQLRARFEAQPALAAAVVVDRHERILGLVTRDGLLQALGRQYGHALFAKRSVLALADRRCLIVPAGAPEGVLVRRAVTRPLASRHDPILLRDETGRLAGAVTMTELLQAQLAEPART